MAAGVAPPDGARKKQIVVLSGLAGAGKTTAARALEDLGFFVVDNLPPQLIETILALAEGSSQRLERLAFVIDAREPAFLAQLPAAWDRLRASGHALMLVFLDCSDDVLVRRFQETRRRHPLDPSAEGSVGAEGGEGGEGGVRAGIARERQLLADIANRADAIIDTRALSVHELKRLVVDRFGTEGQRRQLVTVMSFGYKHGLPNELDLCFDVRWIPNPFFVEELRPLTGADEKVARFVLDQEGALPFLDKIDDLVAFLLPRFEEEGKTYVTVAVGCTGGRHRSPAIAMALGQRLRARGIDARVVHRDVTFSV